MILISFVIYICTNGDVIKAMMRSQSFEIFLFSMEVVKSRRNNSDKQPCFGN